MIERIVENWLTRVNEKSFQIPFCQMLIGEGYRVVHLSRHGSFEEGKDILAIDPNGTPCAFQLKGSESGKITQKEWAKYTEQIVRLVEIPIRHPSIDESLKRKVYFVTNGELDEEVRVEITNRNSDWKRRKCPELSTIVKGELLVRLTHIHTDFWPTQLVSEKDLLELYLSDGTGYLDKAKFAGFIDNLLLNSNTLSKIDGQRILASTAIFTSYALSPFTQAENHVAIVEGWTIFLATLVAFVEKHQFNEKYWSNIAEIAKEAIVIALNDLCEELKSRNDYVSGNPLVDSPFYCGRMTWLLGFVSTNLILQKRQNPEVDLDDWYSSFLLANQRSILLWGEAAIPQLLAIYWALVTLGDTYTADQLIFKIIRGIISQNIDNAGLPDPYHSLGEVVLTSSGLIDKYQEEIFRYRTYSLDSLIQLIARHGYRGVIAELWKQITLLRFTEFEPENAWQYCRWHCEDGVFHETQPETPQSWRELLNKASKANIEKIPVYFRNNPIMLLVFLIVYPHRIRPDVVKYLDSSLIKMPVKETDDG